MALEDAVLLLEFGADAEEADDQRRRCTRAIWEEQECLRSSLPTRKKKIHELGEDEKDRVWFQKLDVVVPTMIRGAVERRCR